ncbi:hypothetical protein P9112_009355 [Eukaryota sp. TZLM1-RC]
MKHHQSNHCIPELTKADTESIATFLHEYSVYKLRVGTKDAVPMRSCIDSFLLESFAICSDSIKRSDAELLKFLEVSRGYPSIEEAYAAFDRLQMDSSIKEARARVHDYVRGFLAIKGKASLFEIPSTSLLCHFCKGVVPTVLSRSLYLRVKDELITSLSDLVEATTADLIDWERTQHWSKQTEHKRDDVIPPLKTARRNESVKRKLCFRCQKSEHFASACPNKPMKTEQINNISDCQAPIKKTEKKQCCGVFEIDSQIQFYHKSSFTLSSCTLNLQNRYPKLAHLALDVMTAQATSVPCEQLFAGLVVNKKRSLLFAESVQAVLCLESWRKKAVECVIAVALSYSSDEPVLVVEEENQDNMCEDFELWI